MKIRRYVVPVVAALTAMGCVLTTHHTIDAHITVDIRHIQEQAGDVLDYVEGKTETLPGLEEGTGDTSLLERARDVFRFTQVAYAAELKHTTSPLVAQIAQQMRDRFSALQPLRNQQVIGENNRGYVELRSEGVLDTPEKKNEAQRLVAAENADRKALYKEVARINKDDAVTVSAVERIYYLERLNRAKTGEVFQLPGDAADLDAVKESAVGKKLGSQAKVGAWVTIP